MVMTKPGRVVLQLGGTTVLGMLPEALDRSRLNAASELLGKSGLSCPAVDDILGYQCNKLAINWDFVIPTDSSLRSENSFKSQVQVYF